MLTDTEIESLIREFAKKGSYPTGEFVEAVMNKCSEKQSQKLAEIRAEYFSMILNIGKQEYFVVIPLKVFDELMEGK